MLFPFYYTITLLTIGFGMWIFTDDQINIMSYDFIDTILLILAAFGTTFGMIFISLGLKNMDASVAAPITNMEVLFTFIADILVFNYQFYLSDFAGALVIFFSLSVHVFLQIFIK